MLNTNFISKNVNEKETDLFFGPLDGETFVIIQPSWSMAHIMHHIGIFSSISQARKNGWNTPIPYGFTIKTVGKKAKRQDVFILNEKEKEKEKLSK